MDFFFPGSTPVPRGRSGTLRSCGECETASSHPKLGARSHQPALSSQVSQPSEPSVVAPHLWTRPSCQCSSPHVFSNLCPSRSSHVLPLRFPALPL